MTSLDVADLVVIGGRALGIGTGAALEQVDTQAAETALAEAPVALSLAPLQRLGGAGMSVDGRMLARFSDHAAAAVFMARQEARRLGDGSVDPEHLTNLRVA